MIRVRALLAALALLVVACPAPAHASPLGLRFGATAGPVFAPGPNAADLGSALGIQLEASRAAGPRLEWFGSLGYTDFGEVTLSSIRLESPGGDLYFPDFILDEPFRSYGLELGLRRRFVFRGLDLFFEGAAGATRSEQPRVGGRYRNDRRPDPLDAASTFEVSGTGASFSLGAGGVIARNGSVGLVTAASARWLSGLGVAGPIVPVRLGLAWPVANPRPEARDAGGAGAATARARGPRLRLSAGTAWLDAPADVWRSSRPSLGFSAGVEVPLAGGLALRLDGAQAMFVSTERFVARQETDAFGNIVNVYDGRTPRWTATFLTAGLSASRALGRFTPFVHAGAGLGRTGGDGGTVATVAYVPVGGPSLVPLYRYDHQGFGRPHTGVAWSGGAGLEVAVANTWGAFLEGTLLGVNLDAPDVQVFAARAGVALR